VDAWASKLSVVEMNILLFTEAGWMGTRSWFASERAREENDDSFLFSMPVRVLHWPSSN